MSAWKLVEAEQAEVEQVFEQKQEAQLPSSDDNERFGRRGGKRLWMLRTELS